MAWTQLNFGKHGDLTIPQVIFKDPDWFYWAYHEGVFNDKGSFKLEAEDAYKKSRNIKIQQVDKSAEFVFDGRGKFSNLRLIDKDVPRHQGSSITIRKNKIDMYMVRESQYYGIRSIEWTQKVEI